MITQKETLLFLKHLIELGKHPAEMQLFMFVSIAGYAQTVIDEDVALELEEGETELIDPKRWQTCAREVIEALTKEVDGYDKHQLH